MKFCDLRVGAKFKIAGEIFSALFQKVSDEHYIKSPNYIERHNWNLRADPEWDLELLPDTRLLKWLSSKHSEN